MQTSCEEGLSQHDYKRNIIYGFAEMPIYIIAYFTVHFS